MIKILIAFILLTISLNTKGQEQIIYYKKIADKLIHKEFDSSLVKAMECKSFWAESSYGNSAYGSAGSYEYEKYKFTHLKFTQITFYYSFYSPSINDTFNFGLKMNSKAKPIYEFHLFENVPQCIRENNNCDFISKDSALTIALNSAIRYTDSLQITLEHSPKSNSFYWVVTGQPKQRKQISIQKSTSAYGEIDFRYIDVKTGEIISRAKFFQNL